MTKKAPPNVVTKQEVIDALAAFCDRFKTYREAARALGTTPEGLSAMLKDRRRLTDPVLEALGIHRALLYSTTKIEGRYLDGATADF